MKYLIMIHASEAEEAAMSEAEMGALLAEYGTYTEELQKAGAMLDGARLRPVESATSVRVRDGKAMVTDGPFAETKEQFGGFYVIDVSDLDAAIEWAKKCPSAAMGTIEVRPVWE